MNGGACWRSSQKAALLAGNLVAAILAIGAWLGASGEILPDRQLRWVALAVAAVVVAGLTNTGWLVAGRRAVANRHVMALNGAVPATLARLAAVSPPPERHDDLPRSRPGMTRYHRPTCLLCTVGSSEPAPVADHVAAGRRPCELCFADA